MLQSRHFDNSFRMKNLNTRPSPDLAPVPRTMHHAQRMPRQWMPPPPGQMPRIMTARPLRFSRPTRRGHNVRPISAPLPVGSRMCRGSRFVCGNNRFYPLDQQPSNVNSNSIDGCKLKDLGQFMDPLKKNANMSLKEEASTTMSEKSGRSVMKKKKKKGSKFFPSKYWNIHDAEKALKVELETIGHHSKTLVIKFPDPEISWDTVKSYHSAIEKVHFQIPSGPRYCTIKLSDDCDVDQVMKELKEVNFHNLGNIKVEKKYEKFDASIDPELIDPYTLYVGNLPLTINPTTIKEKFPTAVRIDVGYAQRMKYTRYAFIRYQTVEESIEAFRDSHKVRFDSRNLVIRFRRQKKNSMPMDIETIKEETSKTSERKRPIVDHTEVLMEKKIKIEEGETDDENDALMMSDIVQKAESTFEDMGSEEEKEVEDYDEDDDDDIDDGGKFNCIEQKEQEQDDGDEMEDDRDEEGDDNLDDGTSHEEDENNEDEDENNEIIEEEYREKGDKNPEGEDKNPEGEDKKPEKEDKNTEKEDKNTKKEDKNTEKEDKNTEKEDKNTEKEDKNTEKEDKNTEKEDKNTEKEDKNPEGEDKNPEKEDGNKKDSEIKKI